MKNLKKILSIALGMLVICACFSMVIGVSAAEANTVVLDFNDAANAGFVVFGDIDANGAIDAEDLANLKKMIIGKATEADDKYADANGDGKINVLDMVLQKKNAGKAVVSATGGVDNSGALNVFGNVALSSSLAETLKADSYQKLSFDYKAEKDITITIKGISDKEYVFVCPANAEFAAKEFIFATAETFTATDAIEVQISGAGVVDNIVIVPTVIDNDITDSWD